MCNMILVTTAQYYLPMVSWIAKQRNLIALYQAIITKINDLLRMILVSIPINDIIIITNHIIKNGPYADFETEISKSSG